MNRAMFAWQELFTTGAGEGDSWLGFQKGPDRVVDGFPWEMKLLAQLDKITLGDKSTHVPPLRHPSSSSE